MSPVDGDMSLQLLPPRFLRRRHERTSPASGRQAKENVLNFNAGGVLAAYFADVFFVLVRLGGGGGTPLTTDDDGVGGDGGGEISDLRQDGDR